MFKPLPFWGVWLLVNLALFVAGAIHAAPGQAGILLGVVGTMFAFNLAFLALCFWLGERNRRAP